VRTRLGLADELLDELADARLDVVVSTVRPRRSGLHAEPLCDEEFLLVAARPWPRGSTGSCWPGTPARALQSLPMLAYAEDLPIVRRWWRHVLGGGSARSGQS
jgi:DNA-binding transcriptional LysR family regulator